MSCETETGHWDFPDVFEGGGIASRDFEIEEENSTTLASASMVFKLAGSDTAALTLTGGSGLTLTDTTEGAWVITIDTINATSLSPGVYAYTLKTTDTDGFIAFPRHGTLTVKDA